MTPTCRHGRRWAECCGSRGVHVPTGDATRAQQLFRTLSKQNKMLLAERNEHAVKRFLEEMSANARGMVLVMCDRFKEANK